MSTNMGLNLTTNFKKTVNPIVLQTYQLTTDVEDITEVGDFSEFLNSESLKNKILKVIQSLDTNNVTEDISADENPLDNIIRAEVVELLNYRKISKTKLQEAYELIAKGQDPFNAFNTDENIVLVNQALALEHISQEEYNAIISTDATNLWFDFPEVYKEVLDFQMSLPPFIPTLDELKIAGIVDFIIETVSENQTAIIDESLIERYTETYIDEILMTSEFLGYKNCADIYADPENILSIIGKISFKNFAERVMPYLDFLTQDTIDIIMGLLPSQYKNITNLLSENQIRLMIDKEIDIKDLVLKSLSFTEVQELFNRLAEEFKSEFTETFTEEKMKELIQITIETMYPLKSTEEVYTQLCGNYNVDVANVPVSEIEASLTEYFN